MYVCMVVANPSCWQFKRNRSTKSLPCRSLPHSQPCSMSYLKHTCLAVVVHVAEAIPDLGMLRTCYDFKGCGRTVPCRHEHKKQNTPKMCG